jgi:predicted DNA-binding protein YlxM (UPF0122 family)
MARTDTETTLKILALVARGDTLRDISESTGVSLTTVHDIKKRNQSALATIQSKMIDHQVSTSKKILSKAQNLIESKLDKAAKVDQEREELMMLLKSGDIDTREYQARLTLLSMPSLTELNAVAREAFTQSQIEQGKPTSISSPTETKQQLIDLVEALNKGDEVQLFKMILNPPSHVAHQTIQGGATP